MKKIYRILKITGVFFAFLLSVSYIWFLIESAISPEINNVAYMDYLLYLLGYGELDIPDLFGKSFFSIIGLLSLTLLSSVFTVSLFDWRSKLILSDRIVVWDKNPTTHLASALLRCKQRDIYNIRINLIVHCEKDTYSEEYYIPLIPKNTSHFVDFEIAPGTALYKYLRLFLRTNNTKPVVIITATYTDISNAEEYTICQKYQYSDNDKDSNIVFTNSSSLRGNYYQISQKVFDAISLAQSNEYANEMKLYVENNTFGIDLMQAKEINSENIKIDYGSTVEDGTIISAERAFNAKVSFKKDKEYEPCDFGMICIKNPLGAAWQKYYDLNCSLEFKMKTSHDMSVTLELKRSDGYKVIDTELKGTGEYENYSFDLSQYPREFFETVTELCFTAFYKDVKSEDLKGCFSVMDCELVVIE